MTVIGTNVAALRAQAGARTAQSQLQSAMERLSTGQRINSAKDDAAGLAISSRMTSQIRGLAVAVRNASDGISMTQTAEGALGEVTNMLQRMKELAVQSANATLGGSERAALQAETNQLTAQINDIAKTTNFNGLKLLDGSLKSLSLQTGVNAGDQIAVKLSSVSANELGLTVGGQGSVTSGRVTAAGSITAAAIQLNGVNAFAEAKTINSAEDLAKAINENTSKTGVVATAFNSFTTAKFEGAVDAGTLNGKAIGAAASAADFVAQVNANSDLYGVTATVDSENKITFTNTSGKAITGSGFADISANNTGFISLKNQNGSQLTVGGTLTGTGLNAFNGASYTASAAVTASTSVAADTLKINGVTIDAVDNSSAADADAAADAIVAAINAKADETGVRASHASGVLSFSSTNGGAVRLEGTTGLNVVAQGGTKEMSFDLDISSQAAAGAALGRIDKALDTVSAKRGDLGAIQNRLEVTVNSLNTQATNLTDARSRIQDADFSTETTNLAKAQILGQAATAMLAQANQSQQNVLSLLR